MVQTEKYMKTIKEVMNNEFINTEKQEQQPTIMSIGKLYLISILLNFLPVIGIYLFSSANVETMHGEDFLGVFIYGVFFFIPTSIINLSFFLLKIETVRESKVKKFFAYYASSLFCLVVVACIMIPNLTTLYYQSDIMNWIIDSLFLLANFFINSLLVFFYRIKLKEVYIVKMIKRYLMGLIVIIILFVIPILIFAPKRETIEIKQNIGGTLICNSSHYTIDNICKINYKYKLDNDHSIKIGEGVYSEKEWGKNEQLIKYKDWIILKTESWSKDKLIIGKTNVNVWKEFVPEPYEIEEQELWKNSGIESNLWSRDFFIEEINNGIVKYKFGVKKYFPDKCDSISIYYQIDEKTGDLTMIKIE